jgi:ATP-dependent protease ClpP protease subunit
MILKNVFLPFSVMCFSLYGCADSYTLAPVAHQSVYVTPDKINTPLNIPPKPVPITSPIRLQTIINFSGKVTAKKTNDLTSYIHKQMQEGVKDFILNINSGGGDSDAAIAAYQYLKQLPIVLTTYNTGNVQSAAALLYCSGTKRYTLPNSFFMLHGSATTYPESMSFVEIMALSKLSHIHRKAFVDTFKTCTTASDAVLEHYFSSSDLQYFTAEEAQKLGLAHEISAPTFAKTTNFYNITD